MRCKFTFASKIKDSEAIKKINLISLQLYIEKHGWVRNDQQSDYKKIIYESPGLDDEYLICPNPDYQKLADYSLRIIELMVTLADYEELTAQDLYNKILENRTQGQINSTAAACALWEKQDELP